MKSPYLEIHKLKELHEKHVVDLRVLENDFLDGNVDYPAVLVSFGKKEFKLYVDDEYHDFKLKNPILSFYLVLRELEGFKFEKDYPTWCRAQLLDPNNSQVKNFFDGLDKTYSEVEKIIGKIDSMINGLDFELNAGAAQYLRREKKN